jgi:hypothetical protein
MTIEENIILSRPDMKSSSLSTYLVSLKTLHVLMDNSVELDNTKFIQDYDKVMATINKETKITTKKNRLTAILVALGSDTKKNEDLINKYQKKLKELNDEYNIFLKTQKKTDSQASNWLNHSELIQVFNEVMSDIKREKISNKIELNDKEFDLLQQCLILRTYLDFPLRNDYADMKIIYSDEYKQLKDTDINNYLAILPKKKLFILNDFKNKKRIGRKIIEITSSLNKIINIWMKHNKSLFYLVKKDRKTAMSPNGITKYLNKIFVKRSGKKISSSMIRHIVISKLSEGEPTILETEQKEKAIEDKYLHSSAINKLYRKVD